MDTKKNLTVLELYQTLGRLIDSNNIDPDQTVEIRTADPAMGPHAGMGICAVYPGFDWDQGRLFLIPERELVSRSKQPRYSHMIWTEITRKAYAIACTAHAKQVDKAGEPYICHPLAVAEQMQDETTTAVAFLHDVLEDNPNFTQQDLLNLGIPAEVVENVDYLTRRKGVPYMDYIRSLKDKPIAKAVKLADLWHNSDLSRLQKVTDEDLARRAKYMKAIKILMEE